MGRHISAKRRAASIELRLWKKIKIPLKQIKGLSHGQPVINLFRYCYPNLWKDVCDYHKDMLQWNKYRKDNRLSSIYEFSTPKDYLKSKISGIGSISNKSSEEQIRIIIESIRKESLAKLNRRVSKDLMRERFKQHLKPSYVDLHVEAYYRIRKANPENIDTRYLIIHELAKYKCEDTIRFLKSLVRCEKNMPLQHYAWQCLNSLGITGEHKGRRKGKKKLTHTKGFVPIQTPKGLLKAIYNSPLEQMKHYDLFLSHSYKDKDKLIELKDSLNAMGLNVYMDWVNDKDELLRHLTCAETAKVITERIKLSKAILYVHTNSSLNSKWTPWELGFAYALNKPILVYRPEETENEPEYLQLYTPATLEKGQLIIENKTLINDWLKNK